MKRGYLDFDWGQVHFRAAGDPDAALLLMLHQSPLSSRNYAAALPYLGQKFHAVAIDTPGFGGSDALPREWDVSDYANFVWDCADRLGAARLHLFGRATGAVFAAEAAKLRPVAVERLILHGMPLYTDEERAQRMAAFAPPYDVTDDGGHLAWIWDRIHDEYPWIGADLATHFTADFLAAGQDFATAYRSIWRHDLRTSLAEDVLPPTLLMGGGKDRIAFMHERVVAFLPKAQSVLLPDATDFVAEQDPKRFSEILLNFAART